MTLCQLSLTDASVSSAGSSSCLRPELAAGLERRPDAAEGTADVDGADGDSAEAPAKSLMERQEEERHRAQEALVRICIYVVAMPLTVAVSASVSHCSKPWRGWMWLKAQLARA